ncbi:MAG: elongation factor [Frankiaceae bacterium]|nr:elongation factor [Frankiaceae bacterium]
MDAQHRTLDVINVERPAGPEVARLRNVILLGPSGGGKSTLVQALGGQPRPEGPTHSLLASSTEIDGVTIWLLDTPGDPDFGGWVTAGLRAADAALFVLPAGQGIPPMTLRHWQHCAEAGLPRAVVFTRLDDADADFDDAVALAERIFGDSVVPTHLPLYGGEPGLPEAPAGVIDVLLGTLSDHSDGEQRDRPADAEHLRLLTDVRNSLIETVIANSEDDDLVDRHLDGDDVEAAAFVTELYAAVRHGALHPILAAVPPTGVGCAEIGRLLAHGFPSPLLRAAPAVAHSDGSPQAPLSADPQGPLVGEVIARLDPPLTLVRLYSGTLTEGRPVLAGDATATAILPHHATAAVAGELVAVAGLGDVPVGATIAAIGSDLVLASWALPHPSLRADIVPMSASEAAGAAAINALTADDPALRFDSLPDRPGVALWTVGVRHSDDAFAKLTEHARLAGWRELPTRVEGWQRPTGGGPAGEQGWQKLEVTLPDALTGALLRHLPACHGRKVNALPATDGITRVVVELPADWADAFIAELRELTDGTAEVSRATTRPTDEDRG